MAFVISVGRQEPEKKRKRRKKQKKKSNLLNRALKGPQQRVSGPGSVRGRKRKQRKRESIKIL
jgi:hypothetical protein